GPAFQGLPLARSHRVTYTRTIRRLTTHRPAVFARRSDRAGGPSGVWCRGTECPQHGTMAANEPKRSYQNGRDEMNLADFPISALQRQQPCDAEGRKLDRIEYQASRYDPVRQQRVAQKVTLTAAARDGLPTPADEHVILALLYVAKHTHDFCDPVVHFA